MPDDYYYSAGRRVPLRRRDDRVAVRFHQPERAIRGLVSERLARLLNAWPVVEERPDARLAVLQIPPATRGAGAAELAALGADPEVELVLPVYSPPESDETVLITDEFVCQFKPGIARAQQERLHRRHHVTVVAPLEFAPLGFVLRVDAGAGANALDVANRYFESDLVVFAHPDFIRPRQSKAVARSLLGREWHLRNTGQSGGTPGADGRARAAWRLTRGDPAVAIAVIDDGFDLAHGDFSPPSRIVSPLDVRSGSTDPRPRQPRERHGTSVLGVAGSNGRGSGVHGVAPSVALMPIRLDGGERFEAQAIHAAVRAGAAVINCSWGPPDGDWWNPDDPRHRRKVFLPDVVQAALGFALASGRGGRGTVIVWAAGNGNESVSNDGYASAPGVIAVAASNHDDRRSIYSDFGPEVSLAAPSSDLDRMRGVIGGILATDRSGADGYSPRADYTDAFGGTSAAAPQVAAVAALMLSLNPELTHAEVRLILEQTAERIDPGHPSWKPRDGRLHSDLYGFGRLDAARALSAARARPARASRRLTKRVVTRPAAALRR